MRPIAGICWKYSEEATALTKVRAEYLAGDRTKQFGKGRNRMKIISEETIMFGPNCGKNTLRSGSEMGAKR